MGKLRWIISYLLGLGILISSADRCVACALAETATELGKDRGKGEMLRSLGSQPRHTYYPS